MRSTTRIVDNARFAADEQIASVVLRLMMAMNDLGIANNALQEWHETENRKKKTRQNGGKLYFGRIQMAHVYEALLIIKEIKDTASLYHAVQQCDSRTRRSFDVVAAFLDTDDFNSLCRLRNSAAFHYDRKIALRALHQIIKKYPNDTSSLRLGTETLDWYFELGDKVMDRPVVREIFKVPEDENLTNAIDAVLDRLHVMVLAFSDFAGSFDTMLDEEFPWTRKIKRFFNTPTICIASQWRCSQQRK